jgi:cytoskeleton protein RodZ
MNDRRAPSFGEELRRERLVRQVSLDEIARATKISRPLLRALETSDLARLPAPVFTRGFIRAYAQQLGLEPEALVNAYLADLGEIDRPPVPNRHEIARGPESHGARRWVAAGAIVLLLLVGALITIGKARRRAASAALPKKPPVAATPTLPHLSVAPPPASVLAQTPLVPTSTADRPPGETSVTEPPGAGNLTLTLNFSEDCWTEIFADGHRALAGMVHAGQVRQLRAQGSFRVTLGNAGGVRLSLNGRSLRPLGTEGEAVHEIRIDRTGLREGDRAPENP